MGSVVLSQHRELHQATGTKKPGDSQEAKAIGTMQAARDSDDELYDPGRKNDNLERTQTRLELWEEHPDGPVAALTKASDCMDDVHDC